MSYWSSLKISASGLSAQQLRMDLISNNIANAQTTKTDAGVPYKRQDAVFTAKGVSTGLPQFIAKRIGSSILSSDSKVGVQSTIYTDQTTGAKTYDPTNPDADEDGYVTYPNVDLVVEMTNMISATRSYEANLQVVDATERMALRALDIGA